MTERNIRSITQAKALSAIANPFRARLLDAVRVDGPSTASSLAQRTGLAVGSASHHLKVLAEAGFIVEAPELAKDRRERWWKLASEGYGWREAELEDDAKDVARTAAILNLERRANRAREWHQNVGTDPEWDDSGMATQHWLRLTPDELNELADEVNGLLWKWHQKKLHEDPNDREGTEPVIFFAYAFPTQP